VTLTAANTGLDPERNRSLEVGAKWDLWSGNLAVHTAVFRVEKEDARTTDPVTNIVSNDGNIRVDGAELGASGRLTREWLIFAGYTYLDGEILKSRDVQNGVATEGKTPQNLPRHTASLWTTYTWFRHWEVGGGLVYSSERYVNNANTAKVEGYTRIDASVAYRQPKYDIRLNLLNVNDEEYFGQALASRAVPAQGRTALLSWSYRL
jgi:catecholate siderophore receptor